jgi:hypothetical protein
MFKKDDQKQQQQQSPRIPLIKNNPTEIPSLLANTNTNLLKTPEFYYYYYLNLLSQNSNQNLATITNTASALAIQASLLQQKQNGHDLMNNTPQLFNALLNSNENNFYSNPLLAANEFLQINKQQQLPNQQIYKNYIGQLATNLLPQTPIQQFLLPSLVNNKQSVLSSHNSNITTSQQLIQTPSVASTAITTHSAATTTTPQPIVTNNKKKCQTDPSIEPPRKHPKKQEKPKKLKNILNTNHENIENSTTNEYESINNNNSQLDLNDNFDSTSNQSLSTTSINLSKNLDQKSLNLSADVRFIFIIIFCFDLCDLIFSLSKHKIANNTRRLWS